MNPWRAVSFHTNDTLYNEQIGNLVISLLKFQIPYSIKTVPDKGSWLANTLAMSGYILEALEIFEENIVFLDADAIVRQYPVLFDTIDCDFAVHYRENVELLAGTMYFRNSEKVKELIREWIIASRNKGAGLAAQTGLNDVVSAGDYNVYRLPAPYTLIFDRMKAAGPPVIEHFQASRKARKWKL